MFHLYVKNQIYYQQCSFFQKNINKLMLLGFSIKNKALTGLVLNIKRNKIKTLRLQIVSIST